MSEFDELFRSRVGKHFEQLTRIPTPESTINRKRKEAASQFRVRGLGWASDGEVLLSEEERTHTHVIGLPGSGKSKFLELLIRGDIDNLVAGTSQAGLCLIDSSDFGNTYYKILKYCAYVGYPKVCLIDPNDLFEKDDDGKTLRYGKVPTINPLHYGAPTDVVVSSVMEVIRILWDGEDFSRTAKIQEYLEALISILHETHGTLHDARYFSSRKKNDLNNRKRDAIMALIENAAFSDAATTIEDVFSFNDNLFINEFGSTMRRLKPILGSKTMPLIVGSNLAPLNFQKMIAEGWVILCNLDPRIWGVPQQKFLGTLIISEIVQAAYRLIQRGRNIPFYFYIDEVGRYATQTLADVINYKRTSRIQLVMAHQDFTQIKNAEVMAAVRNARIKVMFYVERDDRDKMIRQMYGGQLPLSDVSYELGGLHTREAVIKIGIHPPRKTEIPDVEDAKVSPRRLIAFKKRIYQNEWYRTRREIYDEINARFKAPQSTFSRARRNSGKSAMGASGEPKGKRQNSKSADVRKVPDNPPDSSPVLPDTKRRSTRKIILD